MALHRGGGRHPAGTGRGSKRRTLGPHGVAPRESALTLNVTTGNM